MRPVTLAAIALLALAGCTEIHEQTPRSVSTHYNPLFDDRHDAAALAEAHCQEQGGLHASKEGWTSWNQLPAIDWRCVE